MNEPKTNKPVGEWMYDNSCWAYKGTLPVVIQFDKAGFAGDYTVTPCPACHRGYFKDRKVVAWLILPP